jgi:4-amino-4-deoxy-L-arabinose transferase-like glycosyltransferase
MTSRRALLGLVALTALLRLAWAASLGVGNDEAYHGLFAVHRAWSYYDHPPMMALVESFGLALAGGRVSPLALRIGFVALFAGSTLLMARLTARLYGDRAALLAALLLNLTAYFSAAASTFALPDGPLLFFWLLTLDRLAAALAKPDRIVPWLWVGLAWGGALLSKYHGIFLPAGAFLYLLIEPTARPWLRRPGPYLGILVGVCAFAPVIAWNAAHDWASFAFQGERALGVGLRLDALAGAIGGQALYTLPWIWLPLVLTLARRGRRLFDGASPPDRFLTCQAIPPLVAFLGVACQRSVLPHWSLVGLLPAFPMLADAWATRPDLVRGRLRRRLAITAAVLVIGGSLVLIQARTGFLQRGGRGTIGLVGVEHDPTLDLYGWDQVASELRRRGLVRRPGTFLFTGRWYQSGQLAFATRYRAPVLCYSVEDAHGFAYWSRPAQWLGQDGILVVVNQSPFEPAVYLPFFERIEPLGTFPVVRAGASVRQISLFRCVRQVHPFPFDHPEVFRQGSQVAARPGTGPVR